MEKEINNSKFHVRLPLFLSIAICIGMLIGANMSTHSSKENIVRQSQKFRNVLNYIERYYVDTVKSEELVAHAIVEMLTKLDPHTSYIPPKDYELSHSRLQGDFEGVGIEFNIFRDTLQVVAIIAGGPAEQVGIKAGDKILEVEDKNIAGVKITNRNVIDFLRGKKGSKVRVKVKRKNIDNLLNFTITRAKIPNYTVDVSYMLNNKTGYIKISRFGSKTHSEFKKGLDKLLSEGMEQLVLDLRDNGGGYLGMAASIADEFLSDKKMIVYTKGKVKRSDENYFAGKKGKFKSGLLIVLINENSASASEIVAGALQDNDRALIVGRRSFGKGLVQKLIPLEDKSKLRLTIARYYTPSGRCIQKPYSDYNSEIYNRYLHGEFFSADSIKFNDSLKYETTLGRTVYGGGGIMPDFFVPRDTSYYSVYLTKILSNNLLKEFAYNYAYNHRVVLERLGYNNFKSSSILSLKLEGSFRKFVDNDGIPFEIKDYNTSKKYIWKNIKAFVARSIWKDEGFYPIYHDSDITLKKALGLFLEAEKLDNQFIKSEKIK